MKLYLLKRKGYVGDDENAGMLVRAPTRARARQLAAKRSKDASDMEFWGSESVQSWLDPAMSTCEGVPWDGGEGVLLVDYRGKR